NGIAFLVKIRKATLSSPCTYHAQIICRPKITFRGRIEEFSHQNFMSTDDLCMVCAWRRKGGLSDLDQKSYAIFIEHIQWVMVPGAGIEPARLQ
ncbi:MAG: hypothetical protein AAF933_09670, partial [Pseudomonadota bacterium]